LRSRRCGGVLVLVALTGGCTRPAADAGKGEPPEGIAITAALATDAVTDDPDDPAVWVNAADPAESLILGTNKVRAPNGALVVFGLDGRTRQTVANLDRPNNVDVEYGLALGGVPTDIAVVTERLQHRLRIYSISAAGLAEVSSGGGIPVFEGESGDASEPMGIALYKRPHDGAVFAIVGRKNGPREVYLWQYRLEGGSGKVTGTKVREFGAFSGTGEIEAIAVDDALGYVYYADEGNGIHKWHADPDHPDAGRELAHFGRDGFRFDREGIAIYAKPDGTGYILCTDQTAGDSRYLIFRREGAPGNPHDHGELVQVIRGGADSTDGIEVSSASLGPRFPEGLLVAMNSKDRNFLVYSWRDIAASLPH
jgi:3-phytase